MKKILNFLNNLLSVFVLGFGKIVLFIKNYFKNFPWKKVMISATSVSKTVVWCLERIAQNKIWSRIKFIFLTICNFSKITVQKKILPKMISGVSFIYNFFKDIIKKKITPKVTFILSHTSEFLKNLIHKNISPNVLSALSFIYSYFKTTTLVIKNTFLRIAIGFKLFLNKKFIPIVLFIILTITYCLKKFVSDKLLPMLFVIYLTTSKYFKIFVWNKIAPKVVNYLNRFLGKEFMARASIILSKINNFFRNNMYKIIALIIIIIITNICFFFFYETQFVLAYTLLFNFFIKFANIMHIIIICLLKFIFLFFVYFVLMLQTFMTSFLSFFKFLFNFKNDFFNSNSLVAGYFFFIFELQVVYALEYLNIFLFEFDFKKNNINNYLFRNNWHMEIVQQIKVLGPVNQKIFKDFFVNCSLKDFDLFFFCLNYNDSWTKVLLAMWLEFFNSNHVYMMFFFTVYVVASLLSPFFFSYFGLKGFFFINYITLLLFNISLFFCFNDFIINNNKIFMNFGSWTILYYNFKVDFEIVFDFISFSFIFLTTTIGCAVVLYTFSYFRYEKNVDRLIMLLNWFIIGMIILVSAGNLAVMFLGWEIIGFVSYFLINFWNNKKFSFKSAFKAFALNKYSDVFFFFFIVLCYSNFYTLNLEAINNQIHLYNVANLIANSQYYASSMEIISILILFCVCTKSAQFGFHIWLPDSMEAPVPASALIHSATLVTAGVFLCLRLSSILSVSYVYNNLFVYLTSFTAFYGGLVACYQSDIKRLLAYSTISNCGLLLTMCCINIDKEYVIFHMYVHGFFKAISFLCVGNIIRFFANYQDFRKMGGCWKYLPFEATVCSISMFNLAGVPLTFGYASKHFFLNNLNQAIPNLYLRNLVIFFCLTACLCGLIYGYRLIKNVFFDYKKGNFNIYFKNNVDVSVSNYYSNTTKFSIYAITYLFVCSFCVLSYLVYKKIVLLGLTSDFDNFFVKSNNFYETCIYDVYVYVFIFLLFFLFFVTYRKTNNSAYIYFYMFSFICYMVFFSCILYNFYFYFLCRLKCGKI